MQQQVPRDAVSRIESLWASHRERIVALLGWVQLRWENLFVLHLSRHTSMQRNTVQRGRLKLFR